MVRFLKTEREAFDNSDDLDRHITIERLTAIAYIPAATCVALGALGRSGLVPYTTAHEWKLFLAASIYLTVANGRDVNHGIRCLFLSGGSLPAKRRTRRVDGSRSSSGTVGGMMVDDAPERMSMGAQMQMGAAIALTMGSLSLLNASIIALLAGRGGETELCRRQFAAAFGLMVVGAAANAAGGVPSGLGTDAVGNMRMVVGFQHVIASAAFCVGGVLMLPSMKAVDAGLQLQNSLIVISSLVGSVFVVLSAIMNYFHTGALLWSEEEAFERQVVMQHRRLKRYYEREEFVPLMYEYGDMGATSGDVRVEVMEDEDEETEGAGESAGTDEEWDDDSTMERKRRERKRKKWKQQEEEGVVRVGFLERVRNAIRTQGSRLLWGKQEQAAGEVRRKQNKRHGRRRGDNLSLPSRQAEQILREGNEEREIGAEDEDENEDEDEDEDGHDEDDDENGDGNREEEEIEAVDVRGKVARSAHGSVSFAALPPPQDQTPLTSSSSSALYETDMREGLTEEGQSGESRSVIRGGASYT